jgi:hypothetical protein
VGIVPSFPLNDILFAFNPFVEFRLGILVIKIKVTCKREYIEHTRRMLPKNDVIDNVKFYFDDQPREYDYWLVIHATGLDNIETAICRSDRTIYASLEADEEISQACRKFLGQFYYAFSCDAEIDVPVRIDLSLHSWWVGIKVSFKNGNHVISKDCTMSYDSLAESLSVKKHDRISVIISNRDSIPGHRRRREFVEKLISSRVGKYIDVYGPSHLPVEDKWDALVGYKYHLCVENMVKDNYFTEKFADPLLAECLNFYIGCPNISTYFPKSSFIPLSYEEDFEKTVLLIEETLESNIYDERIGEVRLAKHAVLNEHNLFFVVAKHFNKSAGEKKIITLYPNSLLKNPLRYLVKKFLVLIGYLRS